jgi:hypothetical protein
VRGKSGPLLELDVKGNPSPSRWAKEWLAQTLRNHAGVEVLGLDPLRKFFGLDENRNEYAHAFIGLLEQLSLEFDLTILYSHHVAKGHKKDGVEDITGRGAQGLSDDCRWMASMQVLNDNDIDRLEIEGPASNYVSFTVTKSNYAPGLPRPVYFCRGPHGILIPIDISNNRLRTQAEYLCKLIPGMELSHREMKKEPEGEKIREAMKKRFKGFKRDDFRFIIDFGIREGLLRSDNRILDFGRPKEIILPGDES